MAGRTPRELAQEFGLLRRLNPRLHKAVMHFSVSPAPGDPEFSDAQWDHIAQRLMKALGYGKSPWVAFIHRDTEHVHMHIMTSRIDFKGRTVSNFNDFRKAEQVMRDVEAELGLRSVPGKHTPTSIPQAKTSVISRQDKTRIAAIEKRLATKAPIHNTTTSKEETSMQATNAQPILPPNPFEPGTPQHATYPHPYEPGRDEAEMAIVDATPSISVPSASLSNSVDLDTDRKLRRATVEKNYVAQMQAVFGNSLAFVSKNGGGATLYFRDVGRIADRGSKLQVYGDMPDELAAMRIVSMAVNAPKRWKTITFTGTDAFVLCAMREACKQHLQIIAVGDTQKEILAKVLAEEQGGMASASGPASKAAASADPVDPVFAPLLELDNLPAQTLPRTAPPLAPVVPPAVAPPALPVRPPHDIKIQIVGVLPVFMNLRERLKDRRENRVPAKPAQTPPTAPAAPKKPSSP